MLGGDSACRRCRREGGGDACGVCLCPCPCVCVDVRAGLCWKTKNSIAFVVQPIHSWLCQYPGSEASSRDSYTNTEDIMHLLSLSWEGLAWDLACAEVVSGCSLGRKDVSP